MQREIKDRDREREYEKGERIQAIASTRGGAEAEKGLGVRDRFGRSSC